MKSYRRVLCIGCNFLCALLSLYSIATFFVRRGVGNMQVLGAVCFRYFTVDSNLFCASLCLVSAIWLLARPHARLTGALSRWKLAATTAVSVTLLTVVFFLGPTMGYRPMFAGVNLYLHLICPLLAIVCWSFLDPLPPLPRRASFWGVLPTAIYAAVYLTLVIVRPTWPDFYGFNIGGKWYLSMIVMLLATWLIALLLVRLVRKRACNLDSI